MTQDDMPAPAVVDEEKAVSEEEKAVVESVPPSHPAPAPTPAKLAQAVKPAPRSAAAPDPFAVGVRVLKMAPAWLLFTAVGCSVLVLLLGWVRSTGDASALTLPAKRNDARAARRAPSADGTAAKAEATTPANTSAAAASGPKSTAANDAPAQVAAPAPTPEPAPQPAPAAAPKSDEKARVETPAPVADGGGNFTAQVGSHSNQSKANEHVSR